MRHARSRWDDTIDVRALIVAPRYDIPIVALGGSVLGL
jgi:hypothetical protein